MLVITATLYLSRLGGMPVEHWPEIHLAMLLVYLVLSRWMARGGDEPWVSWVRAGAVIALMFSLYSTLGHVVFVAIPWSGDAALNAIDQWLFGGVPPALRAEAFVTVGRVEFFSFCYGFFIPYLYLSILTGLVGRPDAERQRFVTGFAVLYAISFLGYLFVPARGPIVHNAMEFAAPLIQTGKIRHFPLIAMGSEYWLNLSDLRDAAIREGTISETDQDLYHRTDDLDVALGLLAAAADCPADERP